MFYSLSVRDVPSTFLDTKNFTIFLWKNIFGTAMLLCSDYSHHAVFLLGNKRGMEKKHFEQVTTMRHYNLVSAFYLSGAILKERER